MTGAASKSVLIVDDHAGIRKALRYFFNSNGFESVEKQCARNNAKRSAGVRFCFALESCTVLPRMVLGHAFPPVFHQASVESGS
jgi:hypothetical protein